jgi:1-acyl-sn-glycerol-3-phosphate acyltransferase
MSAIRLFFLFVWTLSLMFFAPLMILVTFNRQAPLYVARTLFSRGLLRIAGADLTVSGKENIPKGKPAIYVANHCSHLDIGVLCRTAPVNLHFIGKKELAWIPIVGWYMYIAGHIFIDRSDRRKAVTSLRAAALKINQGKNVIMFPEGTRSKNGELASFKSGAFHLALDAGVNIIPIHIEGTHGVWPATSNKITPGKVNVKIGSPIDTSKYTKKTVKELMAVTHSAVEELGKS